MHTDRQQKLVALASSLIGTPYKYGAKLENAPHFFDNSGFTRYLYNSIGVDLPGQRVAQALAGDVVAADQMQPGDLIFVRGLYGEYCRDFPDGIGYVGIYVGEGQVIHCTAERTSEIPIIEKGEVRKTDVHQYMDQNILVTIRRYLK